MEGVGRGSGAGDHLPACLPTVAGQRCVHAPATRSHLPAHLPAYLQVLGNAARTGNRIAFVRYWVRLGHAGSGVAAAWAQLMLAESRVLQALADMLAIEHRGPKTRLCIDGLAYR